MRFRRVYMLVLAVPVCCSLWAQQTQSPVAANDPNSEHKPGIYSYQDGLMTILRSVQPNLKAGSGMKTAWSFGVAKTDSKVSLEGTHAAVEVGKSPVFYFYFEKQSGFGGGGVPSSTDQFKLLRFEVKKNSREAVVMQTSGWGASTAIPDKYAISFSSAPLANGGFKVAATLSPGEYCFIQAGALTVFDFAVVEKK